MPRIFLSESDRTRNKIRKLIIGEMGTKRLSQRKIAESIGISQQMFSYKLHKGEFSGTELIMIIRYLKPEEDEILGLIEKR